MGTSRRRPGRLDERLLRPTGALLAAHTAVERAIERDAAAGLGHDSTTLDLLVRLDLAPNGRLRARELADQLQLSPSHVSRMLDRAEGTGLVRREPDPDDRRAQQVVLTRAGRKVVAEFAPKLQAVIARVTGGLDPGEIDTLVELLGRIERAGRAGGSPPPPSA